MSSKAPRERVAPAAGEAPCVDAVDERGEDRNPSASIR